MKLAIHEILPPSRRSPRQLQPPSKCVRIARIFEQLNTPGRVGTMTPSEYTEFRDQLGIPRVSSRTSTARSSSSPAIAIGLLGPTPPPTSRQAREILAEPGLYDERCCSWRAWFDTREDARRTDWRIKRTPNDEVLAAGRRLCVAAKHWMLYESRKAGRFRRLFPPLRFNHVTRRAHHRPEARNRARRALLLAQMLEVDLFRTWKLRTSFKNNTRSAGFSAAPPPSPRSRRASFSTSAPPAPAHRRYARQILAIDAASSFRLARYSSMSTTYQSGAPDAQA